MVNEIKKKYNCLALIDEFQDEYIKKMEKRDFAINCRFPRDMSERELCEEYDNFLTDNAAAFTWLREELYRCGNIAISSAAEIIADLISVYQGSRYVYKRVDVLDLESTLSAVSSYDLIVEEDSAIDKYKKADLKILQDANKIFVLAEDRKKGKPFNLFGFPITVYDKVSFIPTIANFEFINSFFEHVVNLNLSSDSNIDIFKLRELKDQYLCENYDMLVQRYTDVDHNDAVEHSKLVTASEKKLQQNRDFRAETKQYIKNIKKNIDSNAD